MIHGLEQAVERELGPALVRVAEPARRYVQANTPVQTGRLRAGWRLVQRGDRVFLLNEVLYARSVLERDTRLMEAIHAVTGGRRA